MGIGVGVSVAKCPTFARMTEFNQFYARVIAGGGTISDAAYLKSAIIDYRKIASLNPSLYTFASGRKAGTQYSLIPTDGSGDFSVTRSGTTGMELNAQGYWQPVGENVPRYDYVSGVPMINIEEARTNLISRYKSFAHSDWTKSGASIQGDPNTAGAELRLTALVNGNMTTFTAVGTDGFDATSNGSATHRCGTGDEIVLTENGLYKIEFDQTLNSGTQPTIGLADSIGGTARSATQVAIAGHNVFYLLATANTTGVVQFVNTSTSTDYSTRNFTIKKVTGYASPFVDASGVNLMSGYKLVAAANNGYIRLATAATVTATTTYTNSIWIKRVTGTGQVYLIDTNTTDRAVTLTTDWQRFTYSAAAGSTSGQIGVKLAVSGDEVLISHAQLEAGATASSPIGGAEGSSQTRNADAIVKTGASALIGQTEGIIEFNVIYRVVESQLVVIGANADIKNYISFWITLNNQIACRIRYYDGSNRSIDIIGNETLTAGVAYNIKLSYKSGDSKLYVNNVLRGSSSSSFLFSESLAEITLARGLQFTYFNYRLGLLSIFKSI